MSFWSLLCECECNQVDHDVHRKIIPLIQGCETEYDKVHPTSIMSISISAFPIDLVQTNCKTLNMLKVMCRYTNPANPVRNFCMQS